MFSFLRFPRSVPSHLQRLLCGAAAFYTAAWCAHLYTGTKTLRGFFGDGALAFLIHLSDSYVFNKPGHWVHLFSVGFPRDFQLLLNALGLQFALWFGVRDPMLLKYIFVFWQFALPGFLYIGLFVGLWRAKQMSWIIFPLISWTILSVPVDWNAVNSTRWAMPIFWMHFFLVLLADRKVNRWPLAGVILSGAAMWGGLYEIVMLHCALCIVLGMLLWWREKNKIPFLYALAALPGALRALLNFMTLGHNAPNSFTALTFMHNFMHPYFLFMLIALALAAAALTGKAFARNVYVLLLPLAAAAVYALSSAAPSVWLQLNMRFDYIFLSLALMAVAGLLRLTGKTEVEFVIPTAILTLLAGTVLWVIQLEQTFDWQDCYARYEAQDGKDYSTAGGLRAWMLHGREFNQCVWDWTQPWAEILSADNGQVEALPVLTFWQNFDFVKKDGAPQLHTNNWTLTSPSILPSEGYLPLKTLLYDLTPLYQKKGYGPLVKRAHCTKPEETGAYWYPHLFALDDDRRRLMNVCPANDKIQP